MSKSKARKEFLEQPEHKIEFQSSLEEPISKKCHTHTKVRAWLKERFVFRYNVISKRSEYRKIDEAKFCPFEDRDFDNIYNELVFLNISIGDTALRSLIGSKFISPNYNPFQEYYSNLPKWDGETDHIRNFLLQIQLTEEENRADLINSFKKWIVATAASHLVDEIVNHQCFILVGTQGIFKTTFLNSLVPAHLRLDYSFSSKFNFEHKDHYKYLATKWSINLDELSTFTRADINVLKTILTDDRIITRFAYGHYDAHMWRRASFCGSTNNDQFLTDETGNRRFLCFKIDNIVFDKDFDIDLIYSQALALYKNGFKYWFDRADITHIERRNEQFFNNSIEQDLIQQYIQKPSDQDLSLGFGFQYKTATDINVWLAAKSNRININETTKSKVGAILRKLGFKQVTKRLQNSEYPIKVWCVKYIESAQFVNEAGVIEDHQENNFI